MLRALSGVAVDSGVGRGDDIARTVDLFRSAGHRASDPVTPDALPNLEQWADSITGVLDDLGSREATLVTYPGAIATAALFAATHPSRTAALVVLNGHVDPPEGTEVKSEAIDTLVATWGTGELQHLVNPDMPWNEESELRGRAGTPDCESADRGADVAARGRVRVRAVLPTVRVPTLVVQHADDTFIAPAWGKYVADHIPARNTLSAGAQHVPLRRTVARFFQAIAEFLTGEQPEVADDRVLATVLFTDIVDRRAEPRRSANELARVLDAHDAAVRSQLSRFRGREVNTLGDSFLAMFDGPQRAIRCAIAIREAVQSLGIEVRAGLHTGECEVRGDDIGGIAVHIGARVSALAGSKDVLVSSTLRDLVIGSGLEFEDRGAHELKGVPGEWHLFAVAALSLREQGQRLIDARLA